MKATLEFNLPEEKEEFELAHRGSDYQIVLWDLDQYLRSRIKYPSEMVTDDTMRTLEEVRDKLHELLEDREIKL